MNIFALADSPTDSALWQHDRHVVKMISESCQMLSAATLAYPKRTELFDSILAKVPRQHAHPLLALTHTNHPCNVWLRKDPANYVWLTLHGLTLSAEYSRRFGKVHQYAPLLRLFAVVAAHLVGIRAPVTSVESKMAFAPTLYEFAQAHTPFVFCGPIEYQPTESHNEAVITAYRQAYIATKLPNNRYTIHDSLDLPDWLLAAKPLIHNSGKNGIPVKSNKQIIAESPALRMPAWGAKR